MHNHQYDNEIVDLNVILERYERKVTPFERFFLRSPFSIVTVVARIKGNISENMLKDAVIKAQQRHHNLRVRIKEDEKHNPWFTSDNIKIFQS